MKKALFLILALISTTTDAEQPEAASTLTVLAESKATHVELHLDCNDSLENGHCSVTITAVCHSTAGSPRLFVGGPGTSAIQIRQGRATGEVLSGSKAGARFCGAMMGRCPISKSAGLIGTEGRKQPLIITIDMKYRAAREMDRSVVAWRHPVVTGHSHERLMEGPVDLVVQADKVTVTLNLAPGVVAPGLEQLPTACPKTPCRMLMGLKRDTPFRPGGPLLGIGARFDSSGDIGVVGRIGYEIAAPTNLLIGLHSDTDFHQFATVALTAAGAFGTFLYGTIGAGPVMELAPILRPGIRLSAGAGAYFGTLVGTFDLYFSGKSIDYRGLILLQAGF